MASQTRRQYLISVGTFACATWKPQSITAQSERYPHQLTDQDIEHWMTELSNWGRWGKQDQAGTLNLITPAKRMEAAALVREGVSISLARDADIAPRDASAAKGAHRYNWQHVMTRSVAGRKGGFVIDNYNISFHNAFTTHLDALAHGFDHGMLYNGFSTDTITNWGAMKDDVMSFKSGILSRGVLIDIPVLRGVPYLAADEAIFPEDLERWETKAGIRVETGDAVFVRTGNWRRIAEKGAPVGERTPGLYASCAKWLRQRDVALLGSDATQDVRPSRVTGVDQPVHQLLLIALGMPLIDCCDLDDLSQAALRLNRWTFLFTVAPLRVPGGTGSPINPVATF